MASLGLSQPPDTAGAWAQGLRRLLVRTFAERDPVRADRVAERFCRWLAPLATRPAVVALAGISLAGLTLIIAAIIEVWGGRGSMPSWPLAVVFFAVGLLCHEVGHALAMKSFGRSVNGYGIGWHWFVPFAYVDTTDAWLGPPRARAAIALAGPFTNLVLASLAAFVGTAADGALVRDAAWVFAGANILLCLAALSPAGENDGAQALEEWLGPRSRRETSPFGSALATFGDLLAARTTRVAETGLAVALTLHAAVVAGTSFFVYRLLFERAVVQEVGEAISAPLGIVLAIAAAFLTVEGVTAASLRGRRRRREP